MLKNLNLTEGEEDLRIVEHLDMQKLPESVQQMLSLASTPEEQDIILMATLAAASACLPNLYFTYGPTGKKYYANLQCFILAAAASGKGIANQALEMVRVIDEQYPMLIAGDSTLAAFYKTLEEQGGAGYLHESEGSVITDIWKTSAANYNTALRKAAEHEPISRNRVKGASEIRNPRLSMLLTGTYKQYRALVPSVENGYFSRLLTVVIRGTNGFDKRYVSSKGGQSAIPKIVGQRLLRTYETLMNAGEREWSLTENQKERLGEHLETEYGTLIGLLGENFHSAVIRMAVQIERMAMVLTAMRGNMPESDSGLIDGEIPAFNAGLIDEEIPAFNAGLIDREIPAFNAGSMDGEIPAFNAGSMDKVSRLPDGTRDETEGDKDRPRLVDTICCRDGLVDTIYCSDEDYETAEIIGNKMLLHMAAAYRMIDGDAQDVMPEIKALDQRTILLAALPEEYESKKLYAEAQSQGICIRTATRWNEYWQEHGLVQKIRHGYYRKIA